VEGKQVMSNKEQAVPEPEGTEEAAAIQTVFLTTR
jgi:hypothetical protein